MSQYIENCNSPSFFQFFSFVFSCFCTTGAIIKQISVCVGGRHTTYIGIASCRPVMEQIKSQTTTFSFVHCPYGLPHLAGVNGDRIIQKIEGFFFYFVSLLLCLLLWSLCTLCCCCTVTDSILLGYLMLTRELPRLLLWINCNSCKGTFNSLNRNYLGGYWVFQELKKKK